jgi:inward rectifier potassium channel
MARKIQISKSRQVMANRIVRPDGGFNVVRKGLSTSHWSDLYHVLIRIQWHKFIILITCGYLATNALFAFLYLCGGDGIANAKPGNFFDAFFFSVQTMASIGYGAMYPKTYYANFLVTIESLLGLLGLAMATGLMFARISLPKARVIFTNVAVITPHDGVETLIFRVANERQSWILEAQIRVTLVCTEISKEGNMMRRFYDLPLVRNTSPVFALSWMVMHQINESSPLYGMNLEKMIDDEVEILVTLTGIDETVSQTIHARHSFVAEEILWNMKFMDILSRQQDGRRCIDYSNFHQVVPVAEHLSKH